MASNPPETVTSQPAPPYHSSVVVQQPLKVVGQREWSTEIFDCLSDVKICLCGGCCNICQACQVSSEMGESFLLPCCVSGWLIALRTKMRIQQNMRGNICNDCLLIYFCGPCVQCQLARELKMLQAQGAYKPH